MLLLGVVGNRVHLGKEEIMNRREFLKAMRAAFGVAVLAPVAPVMKALAAPPLPEGMFYMSGQMIAAYEMPITKIIEDNSIRDIQEIEDREFIRLLDKAAVKVGAPGRN